MARYITVVAANWCAVDVSWPMDVPWCFEHSPQHTLHTSFSEQHWFAFTNNSLATMNPKTLFPNLPQKPPSPLKLSLSRKKCLKEVRQDWISLRVWRVLIEVIKCWPHFLLCNMCLKLLSLCILLVSTCGANQRPDWTKVPTKWIGIRSIRRNTRIPQVQCTRSISSRIWSIWRFRGYQWTCVHCQCWARRCIRFRRECSLGSVRGTSS